MPFLTWDGLIIMIEDPKIIDRWEGMGISFVEAISKSVDFFVRKHLAPRNQVLCTFIDTFVRALHFSGLMEEIRIKFMLESATGTFNDVGFENQQDFSSYFSVIGAFPMLEPTDGDAGANSYVVTNIKNGKYVLSASSALSLQKLTAGSKLQEVYGTLSSRRRQVLTILPPPTPTPPVTSSIESRIVTDQQGNQVCIVTV